MLHSLSSNLFQQISNFKHFNGPWHQNSRQTDRQTTAWEFSHCNSLLKNGGKAMESNTTAGRIILIYRVLWGVPRYSYCQLGVQLCLQNYALHKEQQNVWVVGDLPEPYASCWKWAERSCYLNMVSTNHYLQFTSCLSKYRNSSVHRLTQTLPFLSALARLNGFQWVYRLQIIYHQLIAISVAWI